MKRVLICVLFALAFLGARSEVVWAGTFFEVEITGLVHIQKQDLKDILAKFAGKDFDKAAQESLKKDLLAIDMFSAVSFKLSYDDILRLFVKERVAVAQTHFKNWWYIDQTGFLFEWFGSSQPPELVNIMIGDGKTKNEMTNSSHVFAVSVDLLAAIEKHLHENVQTLYWDDQLGWSFVLQTLPFDIYIGHKNFADKLSRLAVVMPTIMSQKDKILRVDGNFRDRIVTKLRPIAE